MATRVWIKNVLVLSLLTAPLAAWGQFQDTADLSGMKNYLRSGTNSYGLGIKPLGILDPSRMTFSTTISSSYMSGGGQSAMRNMFMETIGYRFNAPVTLTLNVGYLNQPFSSYGPSNFFQSGSFIGGAAVDWRPSSNTLFHFEIANYPEYQRYGYSPYDYFSPSYSPIPLPSSDKVPRSISSFEEK